jgi:hypothetical protein
LFLSGLSTSTRSFGSWVGHQPVSPQSPMGGSPLPLSHPGLSEGHLPSTPVWWVNPDTLSSTGHQPPLSPTGGSPLPPLLHPGPSEGGLPSMPVWWVGHQPVSPQGLTGGSPLPPSSLPSSEGGLPSTPVWWVNPDTLSSTGHQPVPPQSPTGGSPPSPLLWLTQDRQRAVCRAEYTRPVCEPRHIVVNMASHRALLHRVWSPRQTKFWTTYRPSFGSGTVNSAQKDPRSTNIPT